MPQIIGNFLQTPAHLRRPVGKIVTEIVKGQICNMLPLVLCCACFHIPKPMMDAFLGQPSTALRWKDIVPFEVA